MTLTVELTDAEYARLRDLSDAAGCRPADVLKERASLTGGEPASPATVAGWPEWKQNLMAAAGLWKEREDIRGIEDLRGGDRIDRFDWGEPSETPAGGDEEP